MHDDRLRNRARRLRQSSTVAERDLWQLLRGNKLDGLGFRRQAPLANYVVDFVCLSAKLVVEVDGVFHHLPEGIESDRKRDAALAALGFAVLRLDEEMVRRQPQQALQRIREAVASRARGFQP